MGGRNNNLKDQKGLDQKGSGRERNPPKEILPRVKRTISKAYGWTKTYISKINIQIASKNRCKRSKLCEFSSNWTGRNDLDIAFEVALGFYHLQFLCPIRRSYL